MFIPINRNLNKKRLKNIVNKTFEENKDTFEKLAEIEAINIRKLKAFNKIAQLYKQKEEMYSNEFVEELGYIFKEYEEDK